jgi:hypothetical protein
MGKLFYFASNPLMSEHQNVIDNPNSEATPARLESMDEMFEYIKGQGGALFFPTSSIQDLIASSPEEAMRIGEVIRTNMAASITLSLSENTLC